MAGFLSSRCPAPEAPAIPPASKRRWSVTCAHGDERAGGGRQRVSEMIKRSMIFGTTAFSKIVTTPVATPAEPADRAWPAAGVISDAAAFGVIRQAIEHHVEMSGFFSAATIEQNRESKTRGCSRRLSTGYSLPESGCAAPFRGFSHAFFTLLTDRL